MRHTLEKTAGYTLVELLVVLAVIGLLTAAAIPMLPAAQPALRARAVARAIADALVLARQTAIARNATVPVAFGSKDYRVGSKARALPSGVMLAARPGEIDFYADGSTSGGAVAVMDGKARRVVRVRWPAGQVSIDE